MKLIVKKYVQVRAAVAAILIILFGISIFMSVLNGHSGAAEYEMTFLYAIWGMLLFVFFIFSTVTALTVLNLLSEVPDYSGSVSYVAVFSYIVMLAIGPHLIVTVPSQGYTSFEWLLYIGTPFMMFVLSVCEAIGSIYERYYYSR